MKHQEFDIFYKTTGICTDSRLITKNCLFICLRGANFDGNKFAQHAFEQGAKYVIVDNPDFHQSKNPAFVLVKNSVEYVQQLARFHREKFNIPIIGITGSNGKTTTKELINTVLSKKYNVLSTIGNLNNHLGVPFTLLRLTEKHDIAIIEMGANAFKDIEELCNIASPTHGVITNIGKAHLEGFFDFEGVLKTKKELYESVEKSNGTIVVNNDDQILVNILPKNIKTKTYGTVKADVVGELISLSPFVTMRWSYKNYTSEDLETKMIGKYNFYNYLTAITMGIEFGLDPIVISNAIKDYEPTNKRSQIKITDTNTLILDCYNANPSSMKVALESFAMHKNPNKLFILGAMKELGSDSNIEHEQIIKLTSELGLKGYVVGKEFEQINSSSISKWFETTTDLALYLKNNPIKDQLILLKGSRSIALEQLEELF